MLGDQPTGESPAWRQRTQPVDDAVGGPDRCADDRQPIDRHRRCVVGDGKGVATQHLDRIGQVTQFEASERRRVGQHLEQQRRIDVGDDRVDVVARFGERIVGRREQRVGLRHRSARARWTPVRPAWSRLSAGIMSDLSQSFTHRFPKRHIERHIERHIVEGLT